MSIQYGDRELLNLTFGDKQVTQVYYGDKLVWEADVDANNVNFQGIEDNQEGTDE